MAGTAIGFIADHQVDTEFVSCLLGLLRQRQDEFQARVIQSRGYAGRLDVGRSAIFEAFLRGTDADYLLCLDSDMVFEAADYDRLKAGLELSPHAIVSGLYTQIDGQPCVFKETADGVFVNVHPTELSGKRWYPAASAGLGFTLVSRATLEDIREMMGEDYPLPFSDNTARGPADQPLADDSSFFYRARLAGWELYVDTKTTIGHLKQVAMYPNIQGGLAVPA